MRQVSRLLAGLTAVGAAAFTLVRATTASAASSTVYVSKHAHAGAPDRSCATARYRHINQAIHAAPRGGRVVVCGGTYKVQAVVTKSLALVGSRVLVSYNLLKDNGDVGVDFNGSSDSLATHNLSEHNKGGGFLIADGLGPNALRRGHLERGHPQPGRLRGHHRRALHGRAVG
jgi:hypothetical protein